MRLMGNEVSKEDNDGRIATISAPTGGLQIVPTPERDQQGIPIHHREFDIDRDNLLAAFQHMATYLRTRNANVTIIVVGGAVNVIHLQTREVTRDVDFIGVNEQSGLLKDASIYAQQQSSNRLGANWLNNSVTLFIPRRLQDHLAQQAVQQNVVLFQERGLRVLAAPWSYAVCGKTNRMSGPSQRPYDCRDAVAYLHEYLRLNAGSTVDASEVEQWARNYGKRVDIHVLKQINDMYKQIYGQDGIAF